LTSQIVLTTSTPRFRATAMTVFRVPKSTPTTGGPGVSRCGKAEDCLHTTHIRFLRCGEASNSDVKVEWRICNQKKAALGG
jgi:hypothetical protein